jgi:hypothetical protein
MSDVQREQKRPSAVRRCPRARPVSGKQGNPKLRPHGVHDWFSGNEHIGEEAVPMRCPGYYPWLPVEKGSSQ